MTDVNKATDPAALHLHAGTEFDSRPDTLTHSLRVGTLIIQIVKGALDRATTHDLSKTQPPEVDGFNRMTPELSRMRYAGDDGKMTDEYAASLAALAPTLEHHYQVNRHHPEHHSDGVAGMTLVDLIEMIADWKAATERMAPGTGDLRRSIQVNMARFQITWQLAQVLLNTAEELGWIPADDRNGARS